MTVRAAAPEAESLRLYRSPLVRAALRGVQAAGEEIDDLMARYRLPASALGDPETVIPLGQCRRFMTECAERMGVASLGLQIALTAPRGYLGVLDMAIGSAPTLREAMRRFVRYLPLITPVLRAKIEEGPRTVTLRQWVDGEPLAQGWHGNDYVPASMVRHIRDQLGGPVAIEEVFVAHPRPRDTAAFVEYFGERTRVRFGAGVNGIAVRNELMDRPQLAANPALMQALHGYAESLLQVTAPGDDRLIHELRLAIRCNLTHPQALLPRVADVVAMTGRTLQRRLREHGWSFRALVASVRREFAVDLEARGEHRRTAIAHHLGYRDRSSLRRAARRWRAQDPDRGCCLDRAPCADSP